MSPWESGDSLNSGNLNTKFVGLGPSWVNVQDSMFGAVADGVTNNTLSINSAISYVAGLGGGIVYLPAGTYLVRPVWNSRTSSVANGLELKSNVVLRGAGIGATTIKWPSGFTQESFVSSTQFHIVTTEYPYSSSGSQHDITVEDLTIDGNGSHLTGAVPSLYFGLFLGRTRGAWINRVRVKNVYGLTPGPPSETLHFEANASTDVHYTDCEAVGDSGVSTATGFSTNVGTGIDYKGCVAHGMASGMGFTNYQAASIRYDNCHAYQNGYAGFNTERGEDISYSNCHAGGKAAAYTAASLSSGLSLGNQFGFRNQGSTAVMYDGCNADYNTSYGFHMVKSTSPTTLFPTTVTLDNCISRYNQFGIVIETGCVDIYPTASFIAENNTVSDVSFSANVGRSTARFADAPIEGWKAVNATSGVRFSVLGDTDNAYRWLNSVGVNLMSLQSSGQLSLLSKGIGSTVSQSGNVSPGQLWFTVGASGLSLGIESGGSLYWINSTTSAT